MGTCNFRQYLSANTFKKTNNKYSEKSPEIQEKYKQIESYNLKNMVEKLWVNVSFQGQIVLGVQYQGARNFKTII